MSLTKKQKQMLNYHGRNPRKSKKKKDNMTCPVCGATIQLVTAQEMNFSGSQRTRNDKLYWRCSNYPACDAYIAANPHTKKPDGIMGDGALRHKRQLIHQWENLFQETNMMERHAFRSMCASQLGFFREGVVHVRYMTHMECDTILKYLAQLYQNNEDIHAAVEARTEWALWRELHGVKRTKPATYGDVSENSDEG